MNYCTIIIYFIFLTLQILSAKCFAFSENDDPRGSATDDLNILFIMVDDLGKEWLGCYGAKDIATPNIDKLASGGMQFANFYCMPQCTPTRVTLLTGQYPFQHGWVNHWDVPRWGGGCSFDPNLNPSIANEFKKHPSKNGRQRVTAAAGKWQINDFRQEPNAMQAAGFDEYCMWTGYEGGNPPSGERYWDPYIFSDGESKTYSGKFGTDVFTEFLIDFLQRNKENQMFLFYPMALTHGPLVHTPAAPDAKTKMEKHIAMCEYVDLQVGKLVAAIEQAGIEKRTIVIFTTDNGTSRGISGRMGDRLIAGGKAQTTENGICVPFIANCPGRIPAGTKSDALIDMTDILPTIQEISGGKPQRDSDFAGKSILPILLGHDPPDQRKWILSMGGRNEAKLTDQGVENKYWYRDRVIRDKQFKLYVGTDGKPEKLIDLLNDSDEQADLLNTNNVAANAALKKLEAVIRKMPARDADPRYRPLPHQPWYKNPVATSEVWKTGYPGRDK